MLAQAIVKHKNRGPNPFVNSSSEMSTDAGHGG